MSRWVVVALGLVVARVVVARVVVAGLVLAGPSPPLAPPFAPPGGGDGGTWSGFPLRLCVRFRWRWWGVLWW